MILRHLARREDTCTPGFAGPTTCNPDADRSGLPERPGRAARRPARRGRRIMAGKTRPENDRKDRR